jgi:thioredoxin 1
MAGTALEVTDASFDELTAKGVALVDFWAERCPPCRLQGPIVDKLAGEFAGRATVGKLDVDSNPGVPTKMGIMYIPTLIVFKEGEEVERFTGLTQETSLASKLEEALA